MDKDSAEFGIGASNMPLQKRKSEDIQLTPYQKSLIGAGVGSIEQIIMRPAVYWKTELQQQRFNLTRAFHPRYCYRGLPLAVLTVAPVAGIQGGASDACENVLGMNKFA